MQEIRTEHLTVGYDKTPLIGDVNLSVRPGEILTLIGPNGSGKSTILKTITKQLKKLDGTVFLGEASMDELKDSQISRRLSMVMTERLRTELMSGREVVASGRYPYTGRFGILSKEDWAKVDEAIALVHAGEVQDQDFMKISDGQRQRIMLARAICQDTKILILDEPTSYLDMGFKMDILTNIRMLARDKKMAVIMSLHELDLAQKVSDTIACVRGDRIDRIGMNAEKDDVMKTVYIKEAVDDYYAKVSNNGQELEHRFGCSGIDGVTFAPAFGRDGKKYLYVAYGIYGDTLRTDNDYQVILAYDTRDWKQYEQPLTQENLHKSGPEKPLHKYFLYTGNTSWGIQNLAYDKASGNMHAAVYNGKKSHYPNYSYFVIDGSKAPERKQLQGFDPAVEAEVLSLLPEGLHDAQSDTWGWNFKWGTTGLCPIGDGYFYISHNAKDKQTGNQSSTVQLYKWTGNPDKAFELVE